MACAYAILAYGGDGGALPGIVEAALDEVDRIDRLMSHYKPESPLSRLNREAEGGPVAVEPELFDFIAEPLRYAASPDGAFDITVGPLMKAWGFFRGGGRLPAAEELAEVRGRIGYTHVVLDPAGEDDPLRPPRHGAGPGRDRQGLRGGPRGGTAPASRWRRRSSAPAGAPSTGWAHRPAAAPGT